MIIGICFLLVLVWVLRFILKVWLFILLQQFLYVIILGVKLLVWQFFKRQCKLLSGCIVFWNSIMLFMVVWRLGIMLLIVFEKFNIIVLMVLSLFSLQCLRNLRCRKMVFFSLYFILFSFRILVLYFLFVFWVFWCICLVGVLFGLEVLSIFYLVRYLVIVLIIGELELLDLEVGMEKVFEIDFFFGILDILKVLGCYWQCIFELLVNVLLILLISFRKLCVIKFWLIFLVQFMFEFFMCC